MRASEHERRAGMRAGPCQYRARVGCGFCRVWRAENPGATAPRHAPSDKCAIAGAICEMGAICSGDRYTDRYKSIERA